MKRHYFVWIVGIISSLALSGCTEVRESVAFPDGFQPEVIAVSEPVPAKSKALSGDAGYQMHFVTSPERKMIYNATLTLSVDNIETAIKKTQEIIRRENGYLQSLDNRCLVLRIPVDNGDKAVQEIEKLGTVTFRQFRADDVSKVVMNLEIRLDNLSKLRVRLTALMERGDKIEDLLKVEAELARVSAEMEQIQAQLREFKNRIDYITLTVSFDANVPVFSAPYRSFIPWINQLGGDPNWKPIPGATTKWLPFELKLPENFVVLHSFRGNPSELLSTSADDCMIKFTRHEDQEGGTLVFWSEMIARTLKQRNHYTILEQKRGKLGDLDAVIITAERHINDKDVKYQITVAVAPESFFCSAKIYLLEAWGPADPMNKLLPELDKVRQSFDD